MVVDPVSAACCQVFQTVVLIKPPTQSKMVSARGKATSGPMTQPQAHNVTWIVSPTPEISEVKAPLPPITGPSQANQPSLFEDPVVLGDEGIRREAPVTSGEYP